MLITALLMTTALTTAPTAGQSPVGFADEPDSVVATAPATPVALGATAGPVAPPVGGVAPSALQATPHGLSTDQQIAQWLAARAPDPSPVGDAPAWRDDRKPHGEVSVGFGSHGYRDYAAAVSLPIGENGRLDLSVRQVENGYPYGYGYEYEGHGRDPYFNDSAYAFPGRHQSGQAAEYEVRLRRPDGPPGGWRKPRTEQAPQ